MEMTRKAVYFDNVTKEFLRSIPARLTEKGMTIDDLAKEIDTTSTRTQLYTELKQQPTLGELMKMATMFDVDLHESVNYRYYHGEIDLQRLCDKIVEYGVSARELSEILNCHANYVSAVMRNNEAIKALSVELIEKWERLVDEVEYELAAM